MSEHNRGGKENRWRARGIVHKQLSNASPPPSPTGLIIARTLHLHLFRVLAQPAWGSSGISGFRAEFLLFATVVGVCIRAWVPLSRFFTTGRVLAQVGRHIVGCFA